MKQTKRPQGWSRQWGLFKATFTNKKGQKCVYITRAKDASLATFIIDTELSKIGYKRESEVQEANITEMYNTEMLVYRH